MRSARGPGPRSAARGFELGGEFEPPERIIPGVFQELRNRRESLAIRPVEPLASGHPRVQKACGHQIPDLQRYGAPGHIRHGTADVSGPPLAIPRQPDDLEAPGRCQQGADG